MAFETRFTENGIPPEPNLSIPRFMSEIKAYIHPNPFCTTCNLLKSTSCYVCISWGFFWFLVILQPLTRITTLRPSCFTERKAPVEAWIGGNINGCHRQSSMPNNIGGARTPTFCKLTNKWSDILAFFSEALSGWRMHRTDWPPVQKRLGWITALLQDIMLAIHRFGLGDMPFSVRLVAYHQNIYWK